MSARWVAAEVRGRGLATHRLGRDGAEVVAQASSLPGALDVLAETTYGQDLQSGMDLGAAQHAVGAVVLWQMRVLAGWGPPISAAPLRALAAKFEIANVIGHLCALAGREAEPPFLLGTLATAWGAVLRSRSVSEVRRALASSPWGDPGLDDVGPMRLGLELAWARGLSQAAPEATGWAASYAALVAARVVAAGGLERLAPAPARDLRRLLGPRVERVPSLAELAARLPRAAAWVLTGIGGPDDLWVAEARWWARVEHEAKTMSRSPQPGPASALGSSMLLLADYFWVSGALELAARGGGSLREATRAVA